MRVSRERNRRRVAAGACLISLTAILTKKKSAEASVFFFFFFFGFLVPEEPVPANMEEAICNRFRRNAGTQKDERANEYSARKAASAGLPDSNESD